MKKLTLSALAALALASAGGVAPTIATAEEQLTIRWGTSPGYRPFIYKNADGSLTGFDYEIGAALCAEMNAECSWVEQAWDGIIPGLVAENYDAILASMSVTEERQQVVDFTRTYQNAPSRFVAAEGTEIDDTGSLDGITTGVQRGSTHQDLIEARFPDATIRAYPTQDEVWLDLTAGRIDATFTSSLVADGWLKGDEADGFTMIGQDYRDPEILGAGEAIAVRKGDNDLRERISAAIDAIRESGEYQRINAQYFDFDIFGQD
ncbi:transporter substrate-binding domain-containing protein [uncultured Tateyamaria sp.]|uniref:transporter substrate-binding domain-containing protein n=1 Tax=uncultured Tateyamaria sp. TaxID=455651 RepID=UPI002619162B|nr:transporter substrate-binding domain-containing protein [uncultured Tateyamaria sp.]